MSFESMFFLNPHIWPLAIMAFLRIITIFMWLPIIGDPVVPRMFRISLALLIILSFWDNFALYIKAKDNLLQWDIVTLAIASAREIFYGFTVSFSTKLLMNAANLGAYLVGINMGFQTATMFSQTAGREESSFSILYELIIIAMILIFNVHHIFIEGIFKSFSDVPIGQLSIKTTLISEIIFFMTSVFTLAIKFFTPLIVVQFISVIVFAIIARAVPQINFFAINFPLIFLISMFVLLISSSFMVRYIGSYGIIEQLKIYYFFQKAFMQK